MDVFDINNTALGADDWRDAADMTFSATLSDQPLPDADLKSVGINSNDSFMLIDLSDAVSFTSNLSDKEPSEASISKLMELLDDATPDMTLEPLTDEDLGSILNEYQGIEQEEATLVSFLLSDEEEVFVALMEDEVEDDVSPPPMPKAVSLLGHRSDSNISDISMDEIPSKKRDFGAISRDMFTIDEGVEMKDVCLLDQILEADKSEDGMEFFQTNEPETKKRRTIYEELFPATDEEPQDDNEPVLIEDMPPLDADSFDADLELFLLNGRPSKVYNNVVQILDQAFYEDPSRGILFGLVTSGSVEKFLDGDTLWERLSEMPLDSDFLFFYDSSQLLMAAHGLEDTKKLVHHIMGLAHRIEEGTRREEFHKHWGSSLAPSKVTI